MNKSQINTKLQNILNKYDWLDVENVPELIALADDLKMDVYHETVSHDKSLKQRNNAALSFLKKNGKKDARPVLKYAHTVDGVKYITDTYIAFELSNDYILPEMPENLTFPNVAGIFSQFDYDAREINLDVRDIMARYKSGLIEKLEDTNITAISIFPDDVKNNLGLDVQRLETVVKILGTNNLKTYFKNRMVLFVNNQGARALLCALRLYK